MDSENPLYLVFSTVETASQAQALASGLVSERLAVCVNIGPPSESMFCWQGEVTKASERVLTIKTNLAKLEKLKAWLKIHHPYEVPEVLAVRVDEGSEDYLAWAQDHLMSDMKGQSR